MFKKYHKFHIISLIIAGILLAISVFLDFCSPQGIMSASSWALKAFATVIFLESMMMYFKILKVLVVVTEEVTTKTVAFAILTYVMNFAGFAILPFITAVGSALILLAVAIRTLAKVNSVDANLGKLCKDLDEETRLLNEEIEAEEAERNSSEDFETEAEIEEEI